MSLLVPSVIETTQRGERHFDLYSRLLANRIVFVGQPIGPDLANLVCAQLLHLAAEHSSGISLYVNAPGGDPMAMLAIYDTMCHIDPPVSTICFGQATSAAAVLVAAGEPGKRLALPHAQFLLHQPAAQSQGQISDLLSQSAEVERRRTLVDSILARHTGHSAEKIREDTDRDLLLDAHQALDYGLIDEIL